MIIKPALESDLGRIAQCHISAFPKSLSSALGKRYVTKMLGWYLSSDETFLFFLENNGIVVGYCGGMVKGGKGLMGSASGMAQFSFTQAVNSFLLRPWLIFHPELRAKYKFVIRNIWRRITIKVSQAEVMEVKPPAGTEPYVALVVIGVNATDQGNGYGSLMLQYFEQLTKKRGIRKMMLSVRSDNNQAIASYTRNGWIISKVEVKSTTMEKFLN